VNRVRGWIVAGRDEARMPPNIKKPAIEAGF